MTVTSYPFVQVLFFLYKCSAKTLQTKILSNFEFIFLYSSQFNINQMIVFNCKTDYQKFFCMAYKMLLRKILEFLLYCLFQIIVLVWWISKALIAQLIALKYLNYFRQLPRSVPASVSTVLRWLLFSILLHIASEKLNMASANCI